MNCGNLTAEFKATTGMSRRGKLAFTLIEMLVVITIIAIMAGVALPHLKGWGEANVMTAATRQLMDDLSFARLKAISTRSPVYVVFISPGVVDPVFFNSLSVPEQKQASNLWTGQYTTYALYSPRSVGDQPGHPRARYLTPWRSLPDNIFIATNKFDHVANRFGSGYADTNRPFAYQEIPFPASTSSVPILLPYIQFNSRGQLVSEQNPSSQYESATIPLARGSIFYARNAAGNLTPEPADVVETPANNSIDTKNWIRIDWLTGRARLERGEIQ